MIEPTDIDGENEQNNPTGKDCDDNSTPLSVEDLAELHADGWFRVESVGTADLATVLMRMATRVADGETRSVPLSNRYDRTMEEITVEIQRTTAGHLGFSVRARCECGNPYALCHPEA